MNEHCQLCRLAAEQPSDGFVNLFGSGSSVTEVLAEKAEFLVILDVAPVRAGHVLVVTRSHQRSFASLWCSVPHSVNAIIEAVLTTLKKATGKSAVVCEHGLGARAIGQAGCVEHAHLHVIPTDGPIVSIFRQAGVGLTLIDDFSRILDGAVDQQYLYLRDSDGSQYAAVHKRFPSQLVRRLVAQQHGELFWSWRDYLDFADAIGTKKTILTGRNIYEQLDKHPLFRR